MKRLNGDTILFATAVLTCVLIGFVGIVYYSYNNAHSTSKSSRIVALNVATSVLLNGRDCFMGKGDAPYTLVEFGDYECPPCRSQQPLLKEVLKQYSGKIRFDFRQHPLQAIHPHALPAALASEVSRRNSPESFWTNHELFFATDLATSLPKISSDEATEAQKQIAKDELLAKRLGVNTTPSFFLCCPDGRTFRLYQLDAIETIL